MARHELWVAIVCALTLFPAAIAHGPVPAIPDPDERDRLLGLAKDGMAPRGVDPRSLAGIPSQLDFDATHYFVDLTFDDAAESIGGTVTMTATSLVDGLTVVALDLLDNMTVSLATVNSVITTFIHQNDILSIDLPVPADEGESFVVAVTYAGSPAQSGFGTFGWNKYSGSGQGDMVWSLSEPTGARNWWPCNDRPDDKAIVEEWWTVRHDWIATGNGVLQGVDTVPGNRKRYRWAATHPLTTYLVSIAASNYATFSHNYTPIAGGSMPIDYYVYPEHLADARVSFSETAAMVSFFAQKFGEYPFVEDKYGMTAFPFLGAMEHSTNTSYGYILINGGNNYDYINAHELAHQWWGDSVSPETWQDIWLNEGFASYSEALWFESLGGAPSYHAYMDGLAQASFSGPVYDPISLFGATVYRKGAWVLHMLRGVMGDADFVQGLRDWYANHKDGVGNTAQFQANQEALYGAPLDWFFEEWVYGSNRPDYRYGFTTVDVGGGVYRNYVELSQTQVDAGTFTMPVELTLVTAAGSEVRTVWNDTSPQTFVLDTDAPVTGLIVDAAGWILNGPTTQATPVDGDSDAVPDSVDNCLAVVNPLQENTDGDLAGDACDDDDDNDQLLDTQDCAPTDSGQGEPAEVESLTLVRDGQTATLSWTSATRADSYDVVRGLAGQLSTGLGDCVSVGIPGPTWDDTDLPSAGGGYLYLVAGRDDGCGGTGPLGSDSSGSPRVSPCP